MLFEDTSDPLGGSALAANPALEDTTAPQAEPTMALPDLSPVIAAMPRAPMQPLTPPPHPTQDPRQQLMALFTAAFAAANGPHSPASVGALHGLSQANDALQAQQMRDWQFKVGQQVAQNKILEQQQAELDRQRTLTLQKNLQAFSTAATSAGSKEEYDRLADAYGNGLASMGYRITPNWLRSNMPYVAPTQQTVAEKAYKAWLSNTSNARLLEQNPQAAMDSVIRVDLNGDGVAENVPLARVAEAAGHGFATDSQGNVLSVPKPQAGTGAFDVKFNALVDQFRAENRREPTAQEKSGLVDKAIEASKAKNPEMEAMAETLKGLQIQQAQNALSQQPTPEDATTIARQLVNHTMAPSQLQLFGGFGTAGQAFKRKVLLEAQKLQPGFDMEQAEAEYQLVKSSGFQNTVRYMDSISESIPRLMKTAQALNNGRVRLANTVSNLAKTQINDPTLKAFVTDSLFVSDEVAKILQGGGTGNGTSDAKLKQASQIINTSDSVPAIQSALQEISVLLGNRRRALTKGTYMENQAPNIDLSDVQKSVPAGVTIQRGRGGA